MYSDGLLKLPIFTIQKIFKILLTVYSLSPHKQIPIFLYLAPIFLPFGQESSLAQRALSIPIEQNRCAMACQGCGAVLFLLKKQWNYFP